MLRRIAGSTLVAAALLAGCAPKVGLQPVPAGGGVPPALTDDLDRASLAAALGQSLRYFARLPDAATFAYGDLRYGAREMEASTRLFLATLEEFPGPGLGAAVRERFLVFESRNESGRGFFTGYYEPELPASRTRTERFRAPLLAVPRDLLSVDLAPFVEAGMLPEQLRTRTLKGRVEGRRVVPYDDRDRIAFEDSLAGRAEPIAWLADEVELFFLQIQGSGKLTLEDGSSLRVNFADQNGHPYRAIGKLLADRIPPGEMSLQALRRYLREHPEEVRQVLDYNPSYVFFRTVDEGPLGNIRVPLTPGRSVAMDARLLPRGGLVWFETTLPAAATPDGKPRAVARYGVVQDTGGAIRGHGRVDLFCGSGAAAERVAGPLQSPGRVFLLVARKELLTARDTP